MNHTLFDEPKPKNTHCLATALGVMALSAVVLIGELSFLPREHTNGYSPNVHARVSGHVQSLAYNG